MVTLLPARPAIPELICEKLFDVAYPAWNALHPKVPLCPPDSVMLQVVAAVPPPPDPPQAVRMNATVTARRMWTDLRRRKRPREAISLLGMWGSVPLVGQPKRARLSTREPPGVAPYLPPRAFFSLTSTSTTDGSARVEVSPSVSNSSAAILRRMRRMILPERVLGRPGAQWMTSGCASGPMPLRTCCTSSVRSESLGSVPCFNVT